MFMGISIKISRNYAIKVSEELGHHKKALISSFCHDQHNFFNHYHQSHVYIYIIIFSIYRFLSVRSL